MDKEIIEKKAIKGREAFYYENIQKETFFFFFKASQLSIYAAE